MVRGDDEHRIDLGFSRGKTTKLYDIIAEVYPHCKTRYQRADLDNVHSVERLVRICDKYNAENPILSYEIAKDLHDEKRKLSALDMMIEKYVESRRDFVGLKAHAFEVLAGALDIKRMKRLGEVAEKNKLYGLAKGAFESIDAVEDVERIEEKCPWLRYGFEEKKLFCNS